MRKGLYLIIILLFPSIIYMLFSLGEHRVEKIGSYGTYTIDAAGDTVYAPVPNMKVMDQNASFKDLSDWSGKPIVLDVFSNPCDEACMKKGVTLVNYLNELTERDHWAVLSLSLQPGLSEQALKELHGKHLPEMDNWSFITALDTNALEQFLQYTYLETGIQENRSELPSRFFVLIDQAGVIRGYFDSRIYKENRKLEDAIKLLLQEPYLTWKDKKR